MSKLWTSIAPLLLTIGVAAPALAQDAEGPAGGGDWAKFHGNRVGLELDILSTSVPLANSSVLGVGVTAVGQVKLIEGLYLDAELPMAYASFSTGAFSGVSGDDLSQDGFTIGNPTIGAHYAFDLTPDIAAFAGASVAIPVAPDPSDDALLALVFTMPARAYFDLHRLMPETLSIRPRGGVEARILPMLHYRGDLGVTVAIPTGEIGDATAERDTEIFVEQGNELEVRAPMGFGGGLRFQAAFLPTAGDGADAVQTAIEPFVGYEPSGIGVYARAGLLVALDEDLGFGLDEGKIATVRLAVGGKF